MTNGSSVENDRNEEPDEDVEVIESNVAIESPERDAQGAAEQTIEPAAGTSEAVFGSLVNIGFVNFDVGSVENASTGAMVSEDRRRHFRRDVYVGIRDREQGIDFLGRIVEGPFHAPHEIGPDSAITRTTVLHPERTRFRPVYYVYGTIEILGQLTPEERVVPTSTRPRPYSEIYIFPPDRLRAHLGIEGNFYVGHLMGYEGVQVHANAESKNFLPRNVGIFGTVGSGKSNTTQVITEEAVRQNWAVVVVDVEGEYVRMNEPSDDAHMVELLRRDHALDPAGVADFRVYVPSSGHSEAINPRPFKVPISSLQEEVIADILEFSEPQMRMFGAITTRAARQAGQGAGAGRLGVLGGTAGQAAQQRPFDLQTLIDGLTEDGNGNMPLLPQVGNTERPTAHTLRSKLIRLGRSGMLDWNGTRAVPELPVRDLLVARRLSVLDVSETDDRSRNIAIAYTLQALFDAVIETAAGEAMSTGATRPRVLVVIEEVHTFVSRAPAD